MKSVVTASNLKKIIIVLLEQEKSKLKWEKSAIKTILKLLILYSDLIKKKREKKTRRLWVSEIYTELSRLSQGVSDNLIPTIRRSQDKSFYNFMRMSPEVFDKLLSIVGPHITKQYVVRTPISAKLRLELTLRYLASGDSFISLSYAFRVSLSSVSKIIEETSKEIWNSLKNIVLQSEFNEDAWRKISKEFEEEWDFPHCIGCVDSKLINMEVTI